VDAGATRDAGARAWGPLDAGPRRRGARLEEGAGGRGQGGGAGAQPGARGRKARGGRYQGRDRGRRREGVQPGEGPWGGGEEEEEEGERERGGGSPRGSKFWRPPSPKPRAPRGEREVEKRRLLRGRIE
jgi:hypothetical protein